jgi:coenzyme F420 biosynthesis associated uncharacterized protein
MASSAYIDWNFAVQTARRLVRPGPAVPASQAAEAVAELRRGAAVSEGHVREFTGLHARSATAPVVVVDRPGWVQANADGFATVMAPLLDKVSAGRTPPSAAVQAIGSRVTGAEAGALLAFLSAKVLGQFDPFWDGPPGTTGRMLLVAPNIVAVETELGVDPHDFRLWVCLHEETHRVQFTAVPWLRDHVRSLIGQFVDSTDLDPEHLGRLLSEGASRLGGLLRGDPDVSIVDLITNDRQRTVIAQVTGVMSLLEGHADVVMDGVGPQVVPSVAVIRERFERRRDGASPVDVLLRRLLGLDAKLRQYRDGAVFVRHAFDAVGRDGFNRVWESPQQLPSAEEILDPAAWVRRVHG